MPSVGTMADISVIYQLRWLSVIRHQRHEDGSQGTIHIVRCEAERECQLQAYLQVMVIEIAMDNIRRAVIDRI